MRTLHHRQHVLHPGNRRDLSSRSALSDFAARALPLSYRRCRLTGLEPATTSLTAKYQTSSPPGQRLVGEQTRRKRHLLRKAFPRGLPVARVATSLARTPPRYAIRCRFAATTFVAERLWCEVSVSSPPTICIQGNRRRGSFFGRRNPRLHHLEVQKSPQFPVQRLRRGWKQKPLRSVGSGGARKTELWKGLRPIRLRE